MSSHFFLDWILLIWLTGPTVSGLLVKGEVGQNVTVPCFYRVKTEYDITSMCWGRDACPASKCSQPIIWTDGRKVTERHHTKYVLKGDLLKGNVSLTILNAQETDSGTYCCRVEIPGWFNDETTNLQVVVERAPGSASEESFTVSTWPPVSVSEAPETASGSYSSTSDYPEVTSSLQNSSISTHSQQYSEKTVYLRTGLCVAFLVILVVGLFLGRRYLRNMKKLSKFASSVAFWRTERAGNQSALEVEIHAEENIYTIH
ncbi:hepatitis A virus cellular receptor 2 isoform 2 precursor [Gallus gallus]|uniref:hepatitis A virus cellular receptor 2 isoform 2 precursor n=1 Tax=Gallus gallus TaxID=9031 RepID=UPI0005D47C51|nr:hepatitis A virus cellular receptor 2 isoform 2 precursor [Gallus gallus]|eukprot:NP_001292508.1 hepatitis A virus cellular receptor 2 isoform 2 precursor [Gallus gallus]